LNIKELGCFSGGTTDFFLQAWSLIGVLLMNFPDDLEMSLNFFCGSSEFYLDFDRLCRRRVIEYFLERDLVDKEPD
jgi:hypothetical protein